MGFRGEITRNDTPVVPLGGSTLGGSMQNTFGTFLSPADLSLYSRNDIRNDVRGRVQKRKEIEDSQLNI